MPSTKIAVLGFGREGRSILKFLKKSQAWRRAEIRVLDRKLNRNYLKNLSKFDFVFRSPGVPYNLKELQKARRSGVKFSSATTLFFNNCPSKIIGITGTKGKSTTATILYRILKAAHKPVFLAGNIGKPALDILPRLKKNSLVILELSSFQLQDLNKSPHIAVVLDVFPDHQNAHLNLKEYYDAKTNIARHQTKEDKAFFFSAKGGSASGGKNSALSRRAAQKSRGKKIAIDDKKFTLFRPEDLKIMGYHNFKNAVMAATVALNLGIPKKTILRVVKNFNGLEHRLEFVRQIQKIKFYNDSASTNPQTTAAAIRAFSGMGNATSDKENRIKKNKSNKHVALTSSLILIAGGQDKGLSYKPLAQALKDSNTKLVVLFGENKNKIAKSIKRSGAPIKFAKTLRQTVNIAYKCSRFYILDSKFFILFSPGAASFDMFKNYADRGQRFKKLINKLR